MSGPAHFVVPTARDGQKLVDVVKRHLVVLPVPAIGPLLEAGGCLVDGRPLDGPKAINQPVEGGQELGVAPGALSTVEHRLVGPHEDVPHLVHRDGELIVVDKPAGMNIHPLGRHRHDTLVGALAWLAGARRARHLDDWQPWGAWRAHPLHRLDRPTTGLVALATSPELHTAMRDQLEGGRIRRRYQAIVHGRITQDAGTIDAPLGRDPDAPRRMAVVTVEAGGRRARTHWRVLDRRSDTTVVQLDLETGRTHQIRVHLAHLGHPVIGDVAYGGRPTTEPWWTPARIGLHAAALHLRHPTTGQQLELEAPPPW